MCSQLIIYLDVGESSPSQSLVIACVVLIEQLNIQQLAALQNDRLNIANKTFLCVLSVEVLKKVTGDFIEIAISYHSVFLIARQRG